MDFRLLGPLEVFDGARAVVIGGGKRRSLLALLLLHGNEVVSADRLIDELWGEHPPPTAAKGLQVYVSQLRKELQNGSDRDGDVLVTRANGYVLVLGPDDVDVQRFERSLNAGERALAAGEPDRAAQRLRQGLALWRGPPLADFTYEAFAQQEIARLEELRMVALEQRIDADLALGRHAQVVGELEALVREHPLRERIRGQLMLALYRCGRQAEALEAYRDGRRHMSDELGLEPGPELRQLEARILAHSPELAAPRRRGPPALAERPEGEARRPRGLHAALAILAAAVLLGGAALAAALRNGDDTGGARSVALDLAKDSLVGFSAGGRRPEMALPLPGRPTAMAAAHGRVFVATVDSATLTVVDSGTRKIVRVVALGITPAAVAAEGDRVWVADRRRGLVVGFDAGYERPTARIAYRRAPASGPAGLNVREPVAVASAGGAVWVTDGSRRLTRIDARSGAVAQLPAGRTLDGLVSGAGALWAFSSRTATVVRIDPRTGAVTDTIRIATRRGSDKPYPAGITTTPGTVWVLNGNTATVSRLDVAEGGVRNTVAIGVDRLPRGIGASGSTVWVANFDGSVSRIAPGETTPSSIWIGESLSNVVADGKRVWVTTTALDQQLPGGNG
ncbi:MAG TPA: BTAD domain-containing putative transcriptional regulator [Solirubrobacteraceae bacterium]